jgi:hypothetical protein
MDECLTIYSPVAQKGRIPVDVSDLRDEIEACRSDAAWSELPLSAKIRVLIKERLEELRLTHQEEQPAPTKVKGGKQTK